jgi:penicillin-binding protein 2
MSTETSPRLRLSILGVVVISLFAALLSRLWYLQVMDTNTFKVAAQANQVRLVYESAPRGRILARDGKTVLVDNKFGFVVTLSRQAAAQNDEVVNRVAALLNMSLDDVNKRVNDVRFSPYKPVPIAEDVPKDIAIYIKERQDEFPGVDVVRMAERTYPNASLAAHVLGYVGQVTSDELKRLRKDGYREGDEIGRAGIEKSYEKYLRGTPGVTKLAVDASGKVLSGTLGHTDPVPGHDIQLTIDANVQKLAEDSLAQGLDAARASFDKSSNKKFVAPAGAAVVLDPNDGSVIALASNPTYDPSVFVNGIKANVFADLQKPENHFPLNDRAIQGQYAPGSTFKLFTALAALQKGLIDPRTTFDDEGKFTLKNCKGDQCVFKNAGGLRNGTVNLTKALTVSSDVFFYRLGASFWQQRSETGDAMQEMAKMMGLAKNTGIPLLGEQPGRVWTPAEQKKAHDAAPNLFPRNEWTTGDNVHVAVGQGSVNVTPLQLASAYGAFATGGSLLEPRIAAQVLDDKGKTFAAFPSVVARKVDLPAGSDAILAGLEGVVADPKGTAAGAFVGFPLASYPLAAKTGTAQIANGQDTSLFVSFGPMPHPQFVVAVVMEESGFGGSAAAPVARRVWEGLAGAPPGPVTLATGGPD